MPGPRAAELARGAALPSGFWPGAGTVAGNVSAFGGTAGSALVLQAVGAATHDPALLARADATTALLRGSGSRENIDDLIGGRAGTALVVAEAVRHGHVDLVDDLRALATGLAAAVARDELPAETAHGALGVVHALAVAADVLDDDALRSVADRALRRWAADPDLVDAMTPEQAPSWCKGLPGLTASLALGLTALGVPEDERRSLLGAHGERLLQQSRRADVAPDISVCHGVGGEIASLLVLGRATGDAEPVHEARRRWDAMSVRASRHGYTGGVRRSAGQMGFLGGLSGLAYVALMLDDPTLPAPFELRWSGVAAVQR